MRIAFGEIDKAGTRFSLENGTWSLSADDELTVVSVDVAEIELRRRDDQSLNVKGKLTVTLETGCARCGQPVVHTVDEGFYYLVTLQEEELSELSEKECTAQECETLYLREPVVDLGEILTEQLYLAIPGRVLCSEDCGGICQDCGKLKDSGECTCTGSRTDSPFAILEKLKKN